MKPIFVPSPTRIEPLGDGRFLVTVYGVIAGGNTRVAFDGYKAEKRAKDYADWMGAPRPSASGEDQA